MICKIVNPQQRILFYISTGVSTGVKNGKLIICNDFSINSTLEIFKIFAETIKIKEDKFYLI